MCISGATGVIVIVQQCKISIKQLYGGKANGSYRLLMKINHSFYNTRQAYFSLKFDFLQPYRV